MQHVFVLLVHGQHQHARCRQHLAQPTHDFDAVAFLEPDIHRHDVGADAAQGFRRESAGGAIAVAGALNLVGPETLYGRYWGTVMEAPFLHFELCYYQAIDAAIAANAALGLMEPVLIAFLGVTIGSIVISMYLPLFSLIGKLASGTK